MYPPERLNKYSVNMSHKSCVFYSADGELVNSSAFRAADSCLLRVKRPSLPVCTQHCALSTAVQCVTAAIFLSMHGKRSSPSQPLFAIKALQAHACFLSFLHE